MTVATTTTRAEHVANGATVEFNFGGKVNAAADLLVTLVAADGTETTYELDVDYTVEGVGDPDGCAVTFTTAPIAGTLVVRRVLALTQSTDIRNSHRFYPWVHEDQFDRLVMIDQQQQDAIDRSLKRPESTGEYYDAADLPIRNLADGTDESDAVTVGQMESAIATFSSSGSGVAPLDFEGTGDGSTTVFTVGLLASWTTATATMYDVYLDGVRQAADTDYSVSSSGLNRTIVFVEAPADEAAVYVVLRGFAQAEDTGAVTLRADLANTSDLTKGVALVSIGRTAAEIAAGVTPVNFRYPPGNVLRYGTNATPGVTDMTAALSSAFAVSASYPVIIPNEALLHTAALTVPDYGMVYGSGRNSVIQKGFNGDQITLGRYGQVRDLRLNGAKASFTGRGIIISAGENTATLANQGHQKIERVVFDSHAGYPIEYTTANRGWMSQVVGCVFQDYDSDAAVKWPDETANGGNRQVVGCYSSKPIVNVGGCDNGIIMRNQVGGTNATNQGIVCPAGTTNRAKKVIVTHNRFAISSGTMNLRGFDITFKDNIIAGSVTLESNAGNDGFLTSTYQNNRITGTFTDSSGASNDVYLDTAISFTPTWSAITVNPALGNGDLRCEYTRAGALIKAKYFLKMGSTTTYGTGAWQFTLPVNRYTSLSTEFNGIAFLKDRPGSVRTLFQVGSDLLQFRTPTGVAVDASNPSAWASGDLLTFEIEYRIF